MSEHLTHNPEIIAKHAVSDYLSVGPEVGFGELEVDALDEWIAATKGAALNPKGTTNVGWMYVERAWSRMAEAGLLLEEVPQEPLTLLWDDLTEADEKFALASAATNDPILKAHLVVTRLSLPMFKMALAGRDKDLNDQHMRAYIKSQREAMEAMLAHYKKEGQPHDVLALNAVTGMALITAYFLGTDNVPLPSAYRHWAGQGLPYDYWHIAVHDRDNGRTHRVRVAPNGPPDMLLMPPEIFDNGSFPTSHGRGTLEAIVRIHKWMKTRTIGQLPGATDKQAAEHIDRVDIKVAECIEAQLDALAKHEPQAVAPERLRQWYETLSPYIDPYHASHGGALDRAMAELEMQNAGEPLGPEDSILLASMHLESALSFEAQKREKAAALSGSFDRAEDLYAQALKALRPNSSRFFETAIACAAVPVHKAIAGAEGVEQQIELYNTRVVVIADALLAAYDSQQDKTSAEAEALALLLQQVTVYLALTATPDRSHIILPSVPRQRGGGQVPRGWDFTVWVNEGEDMYVPGVFTGRLGDHDDPSSLDQGVVTVPLKALGQWTPKHNFKALRTLLAEIDPDAGAHRDKRPDYKIIAKVRRNLAHLVNAPDD